MRRRSGPRPATATDKKCRLVVPAPRNSSFLVRTRGLCLARMGKWLENGRTLWSLVLDATISIFRGLLAKKRFQFVRAFKSNNARTKRYRAGGSDVVVADVLHRGGRFPDRRTRHGRRSELGAEGAGSGDRRGRSRPGERQEGARRPAQDVDAADEGHRDGARHFVPDVPSDAVDVHLSGADAGEDGAVRLERANIGLLRDEPRRDRDRRARSALPRPHARAHLGRG